MTKSTVRSLRFDLARALANDGGEDRVREALAELDRALAEQGGGSPSDHRIHLEAASLLEPTDPGAALQRYIDALGGNTTEKAATKARALLAGSAQPAALVAALPAEAIERVAEAANRQLERAGTKKKLLTAGLSGGANDGLSLLAATLLRQSGQDEQARDLLSAACAATRSPSAEIVAALADTLLDLGDVASARQRIEEADPDAKDPLLHAVRAEAYLAAGDFAGALRLAETHPEATQPTLAAVRALSLLGLERTAEAEAALPESHDPDVEFARAVINLHNREYARAREASWLLLRARPNNAAAVLVNAQTIVEALGESIDDGEAVGASVDSARQLLRQVAEELRTVGERSRWWRAQTALRAGDGRFDYFCCELRFSRGEPVDVKALDDIDDACTTYLQDAAVFELKAKLLEHDPAAAAEAYDEACSLFRYHARDAIRAADTARLAYERQPTFARADVWADTETTASYEAALDAAVCVQRLELAREAAEHWLDADDGDFLRMTNLIAWLRLRRAELKSERTPLEWAFVGVAAQPDDVLRGVVAASLSDLDLRAAAVVHAGPAFESQPDNAFVVETAIIASANYYVDRKELERYLETHEALGGDAAWRNSVELTLALAQVDREAVAALHDVPLYDGSWARRDKATATAFVSGLPAAVAELDEALQSCLAADPPSYEDAAFLAGALQREREARRSAERASEGGEAARARLIADFAFDRTITPSEFVAQIVDECRSPSELYATVTVTLPVLAAARSGETGPVRHVDVDPALYAPRLRDFADLRAAAMEELDGYRSGLSAFGRLADPSSGPAELHAAAQQAQSTLPDDLPAGVVERVARIAAARAVEDLPRRLVAARLGAAPRFTTDDLAAVGDVAAAKRLAIAVLGGGLAAEGDADDVQTAVDEIATAAQIDKVADYWLLDALLWERHDDPAATPAMRETAARARDRIRLRLDELLGLTADPSPDEPPPYVLPIVVEVGDTLVPFVDSRQDGGVFLYELIPAMRDRVLATTGVTVPGVRMRGGELPADGYRIEIDEVPVAIGSVPLDTMFTVHPIEPGAPPTSSVTAVHPVSGERGLWGIAPAADDAGANEKLSTAQYLLYRVEAILRADLPRFLGPQEVAALVEAWTEEDAELVTPVVADGRATLRLTWLLQSLVSELIPIVDWRLLLTAITEAGGLSAPLRELRFAARARLHADVDVTARPTVLVPPEYEDALLGGAASTPLSAPRDDFMRWLRGVLVERGPAVTLVTRDESARDVIAALARREDPVITTISERELELR